VTPGVPARESEITHMNPDSSLIALDWGTTNCRAFRMASDGRVLETRFAAQGILAVRDGDFAGALRSLVGDWLAADAATPVVMAGMIGSRQGWVEAPYVRLPADVDALAAQLAPVAFGDRAVRIVPGLVGPALAGGDDVIRGEETQVIGALDIAGITDGVLCLPGTHSKWVVVEGRRIVRFATFMTGEIYGVLRAHSILGRLMTDDVHDPAAFTDGLARGHTAGGLLHQLFAVRTEGLFGRIDAKSLGSFMSGLLIGHEVRAALESMPSRHVVLVGAENLAKRYQTALAIANVGTTEVAGDVAAARGLWLVAARAGFESCLPLQAEPKPG